MSEFEVKPRRDAVEKVLCRLSIGTLTMREGGTTSKPEITGAEFAGMLACLPGDDKMARALAERLAWAYLEHEGALGRLIDHMDIWGRNRFMFRCPDVAMSGRQLRRIVKAMMERHVLNRHRKAMELRRAMGIGESRWPAIQSFSGEIQEELNRADSLLARHLSRQIREAHPESVRSSEINA